MKILGLDTSGTSGGAAIVEEGKLIGEKITSPAALDGAATHRSNHSQTVLPLIDSLLKRVALQFDELSGIAISIGPGSFTGLRIGLSTVKGLVYGAAIPVVGIPTLVALASRVTDWQGLVCSFLDARKRETYAALFRRQGDRVIRLTEDVVASPETFLQRIIDEHGKEGCLFIGDGIESYGELIRSYFGPEALQTPGAAYGSTAFAVARLGEERIRQRESDPIGSLVPLYLRPSEAELHQPFKG